MADGGAGIGRTTSKRMRARRCRRPAERQRLDVLADRAEVRCPVLVAVRTAIEAGRALAAQSICDCCLVPVRLTDEIIIAFKIVWHRVEVFYPGLHLPVEAFHQMRQRAWASVAGAGLNRVRPLLRGDHDGSRSHPNLCAAMVWLNPGITPCVKTPRAI
jgi:hypothetical protein